MIKTLAWWIIAFVLAILVGGCGPREHYKVPVEYCKAEHTGRTRDEVHTSNICVAFDSQTGACTMQVPTYQTVTYREIKVACEFTEWR